MTKAVIFIVIGGVIRHFAPWVWKKTTNWLRMMYYKSKVKK